jgi:predicted amino acid dehydrogenase
MNTPSVRKILVLNFLETGEPDNAVVHFDGIEFQVNERKIGWDFSLAFFHIQECESEFDAIVLSGIREKAVFGQKEVMHRPTRELIRYTERVPVYTGVELVALFGSWTLRRLMHEEPHFFKRKKVLFHTAFFSPFTEALSDSNAVIQSADALFIFGLPTLLRNEQQVVRFFRMVSPMLSSQLMEGNHIFSGWMRNHRRKWLSKWIADCDVFVTYNALLGQIDDPEAFEGKVVFVDYLNREQREKLERFKVARIIEFSPDVSALKIPKQLWSFGLTMALMDQVRIKRQSCLELSEFTLEMIESLKIEPRKSAKAARVPRRCAFIIHPLSLRHLSLTPGFSWLKRSPAKVTSVAERALARVPVFRYGQLTQAVSESTSQEVICDLYALCATPRAMLRMDENFIYDQLVAAAEDAHQRGALIIGLGAYTKVIGDSGVTVSRRSPIPVTTGNSYSAAATLWAARVIVEKLGFVRTKNASGKLRMKVMIVGATGSIGRVSAQLLSLVAEEVVIVAPRADKLLELRDEIAELSPQTEVLVRTDPNEELGDTDLIVTATSSQRGQVLDIMRVKPGAVICDCSRPLDISPDEARRRPDVLVIESGEIDLPGPVRMNVDIGLPKPSVYACLAETVLLTMEGRYENFSLSRQLHFERVKEIYQLGLKHGARLATIRTHEGSLTEEQINKCRELATVRLIGSDEIETRKKRKFRVV